MMGRLSALNLPGIGNQSIRKVEQDVGRFATDFSCWQEQIRKVWSNRFSGLDMYKAWDQATRQRETIEEMSGEIISQEGLYYPPAFFDLVNPPLLLAVLGEASLLKRKGIAIVGTRSPSQQAGETAYQSGKVCAKADRIVVSGLALGCDTQAHWGAVHGGGETVAVLPSSLSEIYPMRNRRLARKIVENGGLLISENFSETKMETYHFVQRNRMIAALSEWVVVVEAGINSGTMHTVRDGMELSRKIAVLKTGPALSTGCREIILQKKGVQIASVLDIL